MKTKLLLEYFDIKTHLFIGDIDISHYDLNILNEIVPPEAEADYEYCESAFIEEDSFMALQQIISELKEFNYKNYIFNIITRRI